MNAPPVTMSVELANDTLSALAQLCGFAEGVSNVLPSMKQTSDPLIERAEAAADKLRSLVAKAIVAEMTTGTHQ